MKTKFTMVAAIAGCLMFSGCSGEPGESKTSVAAPVQVEPELQAMIVKEKGPEQFVGVAQAKEQSADGEEVVLTGRLKDFVGGKSAFTVVDGSVRSCLEMGDEDHCDTPWDYCCEPRENLTKNSLLVKVVNADGKMFNSEVKGVSSLDHLSTVVVTGKMNRDEAGEVTLDASKIYIQ